MLSLRFISVNGGRTRKHYSRMHTIRLETICASVSVATRSNAGGGGGVSGLMFRGEGRSPGLMSGGQYPTM